jgi:1,2-diacylglycerol 3-alpha-glucosyltransferase
LDDRLVMAGKQTGDALINAFHAMDLFVFSSKSETQGMVVTEAMAAGNPVVALDASGVREVVRDGQNGRLLPEDASAEVFSQAIAHCFSEENQYQQYRENARSTARDLDRMKCARRLSELYEQIGQMPTTGKQKIDDDLLGNWEDMLKTIRIEWEMLYSKLNAVVETLDLDILK